MSKAKRNLPKVSIIIVNYNGKKFLEQCLSALFKTDYPLSCYEVIMVDNGSMDNSVKYVKENFPFVRIIALSKNYGFTGGCNKGVKGARGEFVAFLNNDTVVDKNWLRELVKVMQINKKIGMCGSKIIFIEKPEIVQYAGGYLHLLGAIFDPFHESKPDRDFYYVGSICGASFLIRKDLFEKVGGFDEDFFLYADEVDLCLRVWLVGYRVAYSPYSIVHHYGEGTVNKLNNKIAQSNNVLYARLRSSATIYHGNKNSMAFIIKNFQIKNLFIGVIFSYFYLLFQLIWLLQTKSSEIKFLIKAGFWPVRNFRNLWKKRIKIQNERKIDDKWLEKNNVLLSIGKLLKLTLQLRTKLNNTSKVNIK
jgi:GT2 family glycosyltransferase